MTRRHYEPDEETFGADAYTVEGYAGIAWRVWGWETEPDEDTEWTGIEERTGAWPLASFLDANGGRVTPDPVLDIDRPERWRVTGPVPKGAVSLALAETRWPGWRAVLGGRSAALASWGPAFQSVALVPGAAAVDLRFEFSPSRWFWWAALSAAAWALWFAALFNWVEPS